MEIEMKIEIEMAGDRWTGGESISYRKNSNFWG
jgi:hypothetical protein